MVTGRVVEFDTERGCGSIRPDDGGSDVFVHHVQIMDGTPGYKSLKVDQRVDFEVGTSPRGPQALNVQVRRR
jgi:CspA family cold shock protein